MAALENAELQLTWARVLSPVNGYVTDLSLSLGSYVNAGSPTLSLVNTDSWRVEAYYKETQLERIESGSGRASTCRPTPAFVSREGSRGSAGASSSRAALAERAQTAFRR